MDSPSIKKSPSRQRLTYEELSQGEFAKRHVLRRVAVESMWGLLEHCPILVFDVNEVILEKGQSNQTMFILMEGCLSVHLNSPKTEPVAFLDMGQTVGELSVIEDGPASAYVRAAEPARLLAVDEGTFWRMVEASHEFAANMLLLLASRLRSNNSVIMDGLMQRLQLEHEVTVDALTGLRNRRWLDQNLPRLASRHRGSGKPFCVVMLDVDHFKKFNDNYGHATGDSVLTAVAKVLSSHLRPTDLTARYGGEEFCVMLPDTPLEGAVIAANRLRQEVAITNVVTTNNRTLPAVTVSLGIACLNGDEDCFKTLERADQALYNAKKNGRNRVEAHIA